AGNLVAGSVHGIRIAKRRLHWTRLPLPGSVPVDTRPNPQTRTGPEGPVPYPLADRSALRDAQHLGGHEDQQLGLVASAALALEQVTQQRQVAQERHF